MRTMNDTDVTVRLSLNEAITILAALDLAGDGVTRAHADTARHKLDAAILTTGEITVVMRRDEAVAALHVMENDGSDGTPRRARDKIEAAINAQG